MRKLLAAKQVVKCDYKTITRQINLQAYDTWNDSHSIWERHGGLHSMGKKELVSSRCGAKLAELVHIVKIPFLNKFNRGWQEGVLNTQ